MADGGGVSLLWTEYLHRHTGDHTVNNAFCYVLSILQSSLLPILAFRWSTRRMSCLPERLTGPVKRSTTFLCTCWSLLPCVRLSLQFWRTSGKSLSTSPLSLSKRPPKTLPSRTYLPRSWCLWCLLLDFVGIYLPCGRHVCVSCRPFYFSTLCFFFRGIDPAVP